MTWDLRLGDCLDLVTGLASLPDKSVDHAIGDPPYEEEAHRKVCRANTNGPGHGKSTVTECQHSFPAITEQERAEVSRQAVRVTRGWVVLFCQIEAVGRWRDALVAAGAKWRRGGVWHKPDAMPQITGDRPGTGCECLAIAWAGPGRSKWNGGGKQGFWEQRKYERNRIHPAQKPLELMVRLLEDFSRPGELILDPYAGSATTLVAAERTGRRSLGWERDPETYAAAVARLTAEQAQLSLVTP